MHESNCDLALVARAISHGDGPAIVHGTDGATHTYRDLLSASESVATSLLSGREDLREARVAFAVAPGFEYVAVQWGIWRAGGIAVPLALSHPPPELEYVLRDAEAAFVVADASNAEGLRPLARAAGARFLTVAEAMTVAVGSLPFVDESRRAMMVYTSGTTGRPKGVVTTHANVRAQIVALIDAWRWTADDRILLILPLHHVHGIVNVVGCALWAGATCTTLPRFEPEETWSRIERGSLSLFMAVPTIYRRLATSWANGSSDQRAARSAGCRRMRLMVSGSAALPVQMLEE